MLKKFVWHGFLLAVVVGVVVFAGHAFHEVQSLRAESQKRQALREANRARGERNPPFEAGIVVAQQDRRSDAEEDDRPTGKRAFRDDEGNGPRGRRPGTNRRGPPPPPELDEDDPPFPPTPRRRDDDYGDSRPPGPPPHDDGRPLPKHEHLRRAARELERAGLKDQAAALNKEADAAEELFRKENPPPGGPGMQALQKTVTELTADLQTLRKQVEEIRAELQKLKETKKEAKAEGDKEEKALEPITGTS